MVTENLSAFAAPQGTKARTEKAHVFKLLALKCLLLVTESWDLKELGEKGRSGQLQKTGVTEAE